MHTKHKIVYLLYHYYKQPYPTYCCSTGFVQTDTVRASGSGIIWCSLILILPRTIPSMAARYASLVPPWGSGIRKLSGHAIRVGYPYPGESARVLKIPGPLGYLLYAVVPWFRPCYG